MFNTFLCDFFFIIGDVDITGYAVTLMAILHPHGKFSNKVLEKLECASKNIFEWLFDNTKKENPDKI